MKKKLLGGECIELFNGESHGMVWFSKTTKNFCLMFNAVCIKSTKTFAPIQNKINELKLVQP